MPRDLNEIRNARVNTQQDNMSDDNKTEQQTPMMAGETTESPAQHQENIQDNTNDSAIKPYVQSLTMLDLESCVKLEEATFPPEERCTREKVSLELLCMHSVSVWLCSIRLGYLCFALPQIPYPALSHVTMHISCIPY